MLAGKHFSGATEAGGDLVTNQQAYAHAASALDDEPDDNCGDLTRADSRVHTTRRWGMAEFSPMKITDL